MPGFVRMLGSRLFAAGKPAAGSPLRRRRRPGARFCRGRGHELPEAGAGRRDMSGYVTYHRCRMVRGSGCLPQEPGTVGRVG